MKPTAPSLWMLLLPWIVAIAPPVLLTLWLMPIIPATQDWDLIVPAYHLYKWQLVITLIGTCGFLWLARGIVSSRKVWPITATTILFVLGIGIHVAGHVVFSAESMFNEPEVVRRELRQAETMRSDSTIYLWYRSPSGHVAGYAVDLVAHHHKILDTVGGQWILVTYCTMCHTGIIYSPYVGSVRETFRLVGARKFNAVFEDASTGSWWYQATGECAVGTLAGTTLATLPYMQGTAQEMLLQWQPSTVSLFLPDAATGQRADWSRGYAVRPGDTTEALAKRSLVYGVTVNGASKAYPMKLMVQWPDSVITDTFSGTVIAIERPRALHATVNAWRDSTNSGRRVQGSVEYWHAWRSFHPNSTVWTPPQ